MKLDLSSRTRLGLATAALALMAGAMGYGLATLGGDEKAPEAARGERKVLYWYDPMYPNQHFDKPGKSPFMDMQLVPKYAGEAESGTVTISPQVVQNLGVRTAEAKKGSLEQRFDTVGTIA